jgi:predicted DNA-binding protein (UPF0251 family)
MSNNDKAFPVPGLIFNLFAIPFNFFIGFVVGVVAPVAAIAAMVFGVRFLTGKLPFLSLKREEPEARRLTVELVPQEQAKERFEVEKQQVLDELGSLRDEIKTLMEEAKAREAAKGGEEA